MGIFTFPAVMKRRASGILVPDGLIIPYNGTSAPSGWSLFTDADGKFIVGAGNSYAVGATGGSTSITTNASDTQGAHGSDYYDVATGNTSSLYGGNRTQGAHTHTLTYDYTPPYHSLRLIKADTELEMLPPNAVMFSGVTLSDLSRYTAGDGKLFRANSTITSGGSNTIAAGNNSSSNGSHAHGTNATSGSGDDNCYLVSVGAHTHPNEQFTITPNLYRALLSAWTNASSVFKLQPGMYAFWQSTTTLPDGWYLCDGNNGTLDLRNYFIEFTNEDNDGTRTGNGTLSVPDITLSSISNTHDHTVSYRANFYNRYYHRSMSNTHSHTITASNPTFIPLYYALAIIQLAS